MLFDVGRRGSRLQLQCLVVVLRIVDLLIAQAGSRVETLREAAVAGGIAVARVAERGEA